METSGFAPLGLLLAAAMSVTNVMTDVWRKRALDRRDLFPATFWIRIAVAVVFAVVLGVQILRGVPVEIRDAGLLFGKLNESPRSQHHGPHRSAGPHQRRRWGPDSHFLLSRDAPGQCFGRLLDACRRHEDA